MLLRKGPAILFILGVILLLMVSCNRSESLPFDNPADSIPRVSEINNLQYATITMPGQEEQLLDVYKPISEGVWPVVLLLHGLQGTKGGLIDLSQDIAEQGVMVFTISWPTWLIDMAARDNGKGFREMYEVISCAVRFARAKAPDYSGDPSQVILVGHSYGASNGAWIALGNDRLDTLWEDYAIANGGPSSQVECAEDLSSSQIDAFIGIAGPYHWYDILNERDPDLWEIVSPYAFLNQDMDIPIRLIHGEQDEAVDPEVSVQFNDALQKAGYDSTLILHNGSHRVPIELTSSEILKVIDIIGE